MRKNCGRPVENFIKIRACENLQKTDFRKFRKPNKLVINCAATSLCSSHPQNGVSSIMHGSIDPLLYTDLLSFRPADMIPEPQFSPLRVCNYLIFYIIFEDHQKVACHA